MNKANNSKTEEKTWSVANIKLYLYLAYITVVYKLFHIHDDTHNGWFVKKRPLVMLLISPILLPFFMLFGIVLYYDWATNYYFAWVSGSKRKLTFKETLALKYQLRPLN